MKTGDGKRFGESVCKLICGSNMGNMKMAILNLFANEVVVKCNMFHT